MVTGLAEIILGISIVALGYTYAGYPLLLWLVSRWRELVVRLLLENGWVTPGP